MDAADSMSIFGQARCLHTAVCVRSFTSTRYTLYVLQVNMEWPGIMGRHSDQSYTGTLFAVTLAFSLIRTRLHFCLFLEVKTNRTGVRA